MGICNLASERKDVLRMRVSRRRFIGFGVAACAGVALTGLGSLAPAAWFPRPPRALPGGEFTARCMRCGACVQACPTRALAQRDLSPDFRNIGVPYIEARLGGCEAWGNGCRICADVCPSGALNPAADLAGMHLAVARFIPSDCTNCMVCLRRCPVPKAVYFPNPGGGAPWYREQESEIPAALKIVTSPIKPIIDESLCVGCGLCVAHCIPKIMHLAPYGAPGGGRP